MVLLSLVDPVALADLAVRVGLTLLVVPPELLVLRAPLAHLVLQVSLVVRVDPADPGVPAIRAGLVDPVDLVGLAARP